MCEAELQHADFPLHVSAALFEILHHLYFMPSCRRRPIISISSAAAFPNSALELSKGWQTRLRMVGLVPSLQRLVAVLIESIAFCMGWRTRLRMVGPVPSLQRLVAIL